MARPNSSAQKDRRGNNNMARRNYQSPAASASGGGGRSQNTNATPESQEDSVTTEAIIAKLAKAKDIETQLEAIAAEKKKSSSSNKHQKQQQRSSGNTDEKAQALRLQLCEVLSDVILNDCQLAESQDAIGRLWKNCFYGRINDIRSRILKEKSRAKKRQADGAEASKKAVAELERQLKQFLKEAIQLYRYIIERYVKELLPLSQSQLSGVSEYSQQQEGEEQRSLVIISSLFKMNIHLGDLYRYSSSYKLAEECYSKSAKLAPGTGNPFNQLAVIAQQPQGVDHNTTSLTAVALYYYARSLMATRAPFETSRSNVIRLFESNRKWMEEHLREDDDHSRGIVNVGGNFVGNEAAAVGGGAATKGNKNNKKAQKEWMQRERQAMNRKAMARMVDLQWAFFRGVSLDDDDDDDSGTNKNTTTGKLDLDKLISKMSSLLETYTHLISHASFSESLLCKLICILSYSTLGASNNGGRLVNVNGFDAKRAKDTRWNEGIIMTNQALAFSFILRFIAMLAKDVNVVIAKKKEGAADSANKLGSIRSLSPLLLGFRFAISIYEGGCEWFHGMPFFPGSDGMAAAGSEMEGNTIYKLCKESHVEFWKAIASLSNCCDSLPSVLKNKKKQQSKGGENDDEVDLLDVKDFTEYLGFVPFAPFLDKHVAGGSSANKAKKYASVDDAIVALSETNKQSGVGKANEAETNLKINLFLSIVNGMTSRGDNDDQFFLIKNPDTGERVFSIADNMSTDDGAGEEEEVSSKQEEIITSPVQSPNITDDVMDIDDAQAMDEKADEAQNIAPLGMALLTPAALLAGNIGSANEQPTNQIEENKKAPQPAPLPVDSILAPSSAPPMPNNQQNIMAASSAEALLNPTALSSKQPEPLKASLPPPPGFSMQPPAPAASNSQQLPLASGPGISLADFTAPTRQPDHHTLQFGSSQQPMLTGNIIPQTSGLNNPATSSNLFETMNPFAQPPAPAASYNGFIPTSNSYNNLNQGAPPGLINQSLGVGNINQQQANQGLDPTLDFLLSSNKPASTSALDLLVSPETDDTDDPSESIMNFLFSDTSQTGHRPLYANRQQHSSQPQQGMPPTKNPFAT